MDKPIELNLEDGDNVFDKMQEAMLAGFKANNFPDQLARDFVCLRLHWAHAWGIMHVLVNGKPGFALVQGGEDPNYAHVFAVVTPSDMKIESFTGEVMDANKRIKLTKIKDMPTKQ